MGVKPRLRHIKIGVEDRSIWHRFKRNVSITLLGSGVSLAIKLGQTALLTRLLKIDDYGACSSFSISSSFSILSSGCA